MAVTPAPDVAPSSSSWSWTRGLIGVPEAFISQCVASKTEQQILRAVVTQGLALEGLIDALVDLDRVNRDTKRHNSSNSPLACLFAKIF